MAHKLIVIAVVGLTAAAACMGAAAAIGGKDFKEGFDGFNLFDGRPRCEAVPGATASGRDLDWDGSDEVTLAVQGQASYAPGHDNRLHANGDPQVLAHLRVRDGRIEMDCRGWHNRTRDVMITLPGREFREFTIAGGGKLALDRLNQSKAEITIAGTGNVKANGRIDDLEMTIAGSGDADFNQLTARKAEFGIAGSGTVKAKGTVDELEIGIAGSGRADFNGMTARSASAEIGGSGTVNAKGKIDNVKIDISGSGNADFGQMETRTAEVEISGHGDVHIAPSERAKIEINGSGDVYLHKDPKSLDTEMHGSGRVHKAGTGG
ncbi:MAG TPA: DUF2807 domain-containing protein [Rhizomicrobium sp.]|nr:DUF2807 domain-containing protein [Rhizomicrobium sp.]